MGRRVRKSGERGTRLKRGRGLGGPIIASWDAMQLVGGVTIFESGWVWTGACLAGNLVGISGSIPVAKTQEGGHSVRWRKGGCGKEAKKML